MQNVHYATVTAIHPLPAGRKRVLWRSEGKSGTYGGIAPATMALSEIGAAVVIHTESGQITKVER